MNKLYFLSFSLAPVKALCKECVVERCRMLRLKNQLNEDYKTVTNLLKTTIKGYVPPCIIHDKLRKNKKY